MAMTDDGLGFSETCSLCLTEVPWISLTETSQGNVCVGCVLDGLATDDEGKNLSPHLCDCGKGAACPLWDQVRP